MQVTGFACSKQAAPSVIVQVTCLLLWCCSQETELPTAQMYAKMHAQQQQEQPGSRAHVVEQGASTAQQAGTGAGAGVEEDMLEGPSADADTGAAREGSANDAAAGPHSD
jgi:hypothetical protein